DVRDQARRQVLRARAEKLLPGRERSCGQPRLFQQALQGAAHQVVVVDDGDEPRLLRNHARKIGGGLTARHYPLVCRGPAATRPAIRTSSASEPARIFLMTRPRWILTVTSLVPSCAATCLLSIPETTRAITSRSRGVRVAYRSWSALSSSCCRRATWSRSSAWWTIPSSSSWSKGLVRNSTAPAFIALTVVGMSPCAVTKMIGIESPERRSSRWTSRPSIPGSWRSSTRQLGPSPRSRPRNSRAVAKVSARKPADLNRSAIEARTSSSSSTTNTVGVGPEPLMTHTRGHYSPAACRRPLPVHRDPATLVTPTVRCRALD